MKKYAFTFSGRLTFSGPIKRHNFLLRCMPGTYPFQRSYAGGLTVTPFAALTHLSDAHGNEMYTGAIDKKHDSFSFTASGFVLLSKYFIHEPLDRLYLYPTELTQPTAALSSLVSQQALPQDPWQRAQFLCTLTHRHMAPAEHTETKTAGEAFQAGEGTPRDCTHVLLTLCRLCGIGARFVSGLTVGRETPHCWAEVYVGGVWRALDPFTGLPVEDGYLKIAQGPQGDACALLRNCFQSGPEKADFRREFSVQVTEHVIRTRDTVPHA